MNLLNRERALLVLDKRFCWSRSAFDDANDWTDCKNELKHYYVKYYAQTKTHAREKKEHLIKINRVKNMQKLMKMTITMQKKMLMVD